MNDKLEVTCIEVDGEVIYDAPKLKNSIFMIKPVEVAGIEISSADGDLILKNLGTWDSVTINPVNWPKIKNAIDKFIDENKE